MKMMAKNDSATVLALLLAVLLLGGGALLTSGCNIDFKSETAGDDSGESAEKAEGEDGEEEEKKEDAVPVEVADLFTGEIEAVLSYSTNLEAESHVQVHAQASRQVVRLLVEEGDRVRKGAVLVRLMDDEQRNNLAMAKSDLAKARREYERNQRLFNESLISEQVFNDATWNIEQLEIKLENAQRELGYTEVRAPISGTVTSRLVKLGDQITVGQHLFDIVDFDSIVARVYIPEKYLPQLRTGQVARISSPSLGSKVYTGAVERISPVVDPKSGTVKITVALGGQPGLRTGMYVDVDLVTAFHQDAVLVPKTAIVYDNDRMFVYTLGDDSRAKKILLTPALANKDFIEPAEGMIGLKVGDPIIVAGQTGLKDGTLVELPEVETADADDTEGAAGNLADGEAVESNSEAATEGEVQEAAEEQTDAGGEPAAEAVVASTTGGRAGR